MTRNDIKALLASLPVAQLAYSKAYHRAIKQGKSMNEATAIGRLAAIKARDYVAKQRKAG